MSNSTKDVRESDLQPYQFRLTHLLLFPVLLALFFSVSLVGGFGMGAIATAFLTAFVWDIFLPRMKAVSRLLVLGLMLGMCLWPVFEGPGRHASSRTACRKAMRQIGMALHQYHDRYGCFPPAFVTDADGNPVHSWRVLILPYLGRPDVYQKYRFDEPWNGPNNRQLADAIIEAYNCPADPDYPSPNTNYVAVAGQRTAWPDEIPQWITNFADGTSNTILLVEVADSDIHWMEPRDLRLDELPLTIDGVKSTGISGNHPERSRYPLQEPLCFNVLMADGSASTLSNDLSIETLRELLIIDDGEPRKDDWRW